MNVPIVMAGFPLLGPHRETLVMLEWYSHWLAAMLTAGQRTTTDDRADGQRTTKTTTDGQGKHMQSTYIQYELKKIYHCPFSISVDYRRIKLL